MATLGRGPAGETIDTPRHRALASTSRAALLRLVRDAGDGMTAGEAASATGLHLTTVRAHLERLTEAGLLVRVRSADGAPGRPAWRYRAAAPTPAPASYRGLAAALLDNLADTGGDVRDAAVRVGRRWGRRLAEARGPGAGPIGAVVDVLDDLGFAPRTAAHESDASMVELHLQTCPFLELATGNPDAMCGLHLGVIRGVLERAGGSDDPVVLEPFGAPTACVARAPAPRPGGRARRPVLDLLQAAGGFVETVFPAPGHYPFISHIMVDAERGARGVVEVR